MTKTPTKPSQTQGRSAKSAAALKANLARRKAVKPTSSVKKSTTPPKREG